MIELWLNPSRRITLYPKGLYPRCRMTLEKPSTFSSLKSDTDQIADGGRIIVTM
jgi:hypothetical protein